jgi:hypothetical protein
MFDSRNAWIGFSWYSVLNSIHCPGENETSQNRRDRRFWNIQICLLPMWTIQLTIDPIDFSSSEIPEYPKTLTQRQLDWFLINRDRADLPEQEQKTPSIMSQFDPPVGVFRDAKGEDCSD